MGSAASAHSRSVASTAEAFDSQHEIATWDVERVAEFLDGEAECSAVAAYARAHAVDGAAVLKMDKPTLIEITGTTDAGVTATRRLLELLHPVESKPPTKEVGGDGIDDASDAAADAKAEADIDHSDKLDSSYQSTRLVHSKGSVFLAGVNRGAASAVNASELERGSASGFEYKDGFQVCYHSKVFGTITKRLGAGAMGTVYDFEYESEETEGGVTHVVRRRAALKTIRSDASAKEVEELEKLLTTEVSIVFAAGRSPQIASVINVLIPLPDVDTNAKGTMLVCDLIDGGDFEEATHSGEKKSNGELKHDFAGRLYSDEGAKTWPLASVLLQIFKGFEHIHGRGIIHQVRRRRERES